MAQPIKTHEQRGWKLVIKQQGRGGSRFKKYEDRSIIVFKRSKKTSAASISFPKSVIQALGEPAYIAIMTRGTLVGLVGSTSEQGYKVYYLSNGKPIMPVIKVTQFAKDFDVEEGIYDVRLEDDVFVFDTKVVPAKI